MTTTYCTPAEIRTQIEKVGATGAGSDAALTVIINAIEKGIDAFCNRPDGFVAPATTAARYFPGSGKAYQWIDEAAAITAVAVKDSSSDDEDAYTAWTLGVVGTTTDADVFPATGDPRYPDFVRTPYTLLLVGSNGDYSSFPSGRFITRGGFRPTGNYGRGLPVVKVTAKWGYALTVPPAIKQATIALAARFFKQGESAWADTLASQELGQLLYQRENADIAWLLKEGRFIRPAIGAHR